GGLGCQGWGDGLEGGGGGGVAANPVAAALLASVARYRLSPERLHALIAARRFDLDTEPMRSLAELEAYAEGASAGLIALAAQVLAGGLDIGALSRHAGLAHAFAGLLAAFPIHAARGKVFVRRDILAQQGAAGGDAMGGPATPQLNAAWGELRLHARRHLRAAQELVASAPPAVLPALLPVALAGPTL